MPLNMHLLCSVFGQLCVASNTVSGTRELALLVAVEHGVHGMDNTYTNLWHTIAGHLQQPSGYCKRPEALCNYNDGSAALGHSQQPLQSSSACLDIIGQSVYIPNNTCDDSAMRVDQAGMSARYGTMSEIKVHYAPVQRSSPGNAAKEASTPTATGITTCIVGLEPVYGSQTNRCGALMGFAALNLAGTEQGGTKSLLLTPTQRITKITAKGSG